MTSVVSYMFVLLSSLLLVLSSRQASIVKAFSITSTKPYAVNLRVAVKPDRRQEFLDLIRDNQQKTLAEEPKSLQYVVGEDTSTKNVFYLHEQFTSVEGLEEHRATAHNANWIAFKNTNPFESEPVVECYHVENAADLKNPMEKKTIVPAKTYCVEVELYCKPELRQEFLECIDHNNKGSNTQEPLCYQYVYGESTSIPNKFIFHEEYQGLEGFDAHSKMPHFAAWEVFAATNPFTKDPVVNFMETL